MSKTPIYDIEHLQSGSESPEVPINEHSDAIEIALNATKEWTIAGDVQPTKAQMAEGVFHLLSGSPASPFAFGIPALARHFVVINETGQTCTVYIQGASGAGVDVDDGETVTLRSDGVNVEEVGSGGGAPGAFSGARVKKSVDQTAADYTTGTALTFDAEVFDTDGYHSTVSATSRLVAPFDGYYELFGTIGTSSGTGDTYRHCEIIRGVANQIEGSMGFVEGGNTLNRMAVASGPVFATAGTYWELFLRQETDASITVEEDQTFFSIRYLGA